MYEKLNLNVGDRVHVYSRYHESIQTVTKVTPKGSFRISNSNSLFDEYGREKGTDVWGGSNVELLTPEIERAFMTKVYRKKIKEFNFNDISYEQCIEIIKILGIDELTD